ncbi:MAG: hypothetical protein ACREHC_05915 [Candidatus Levyibacteriota bacterium]
MVWYKKVLIKHTKEIISSALISIIISLALLYWYFVLGNRFEWKTIEPISAPDYYARIFYSALVYITFGAILYKLFIYKLLHFVTVRVLRDWKLYKDIKRFIWGVLLLISYFWFVPKVVDFLNLTISFFYNILGLILYLIPPLGISLIIFAVFFILVKKFNYAVLKR